MMYRGVVAVAFAVMMAGGPASAQMSSYEREKVERAFDAKAVQQDPTLFDGTSFLPDADLNTAYKYMVAYIKGANNAVSAINGLSSASRGSDEGIALAEQAMEMQAYSKAMRAAFPAFEQAKKSGASTVSADGAASGEDGLTDAQRAPVADPLDKIDALMTDSIFDGTEIDMTVTTAEADAFADAFIDNANAAAKAINAMPGNLRRTPGGKALFKRVSQRLKEARVLNKALRTHAEARKEFETVEEPAGETATATASGESVTPAASGGDPKVRAAVDAFKALMADGRYDGKAFDKDLPMSAAEAFKTEATAAANAANAALEASGDDTYREDVADALNKARRIQGAILNHRVVIQRREGAAAIAKQEAEAAERRRKRDEQAAAAAAEKKRLKDEAAAREAARAGLGDVCKAFDKKVMTRRLTRNVQDLFDLVNGPEQFSASLAKIDGVLEASEKINKGCADPAFAKVVELGCSENPVEDPKAWCDAAAGAKEAARVQILKPRSSWEIIANERYDNYDEMERSNGWATIEGPVTFDEALSFDRVIYTKTPDFDETRQRAVLERLDIKPEDYPHFEDTAEIIDEFREAIEDGASRWPAIHRAAEGDDTNYGTELASRLLLKNWHTDAELKDAWLGRGSWKIHKNSLGVIERRSLPGYVMFKLPDDPFCQVRSFTLVEQYTGANTFQKAKGMRFGYVRFQDCDRR